MRQLAVLSLIASTSLAQTCVDLVGDQIKVNEARWEPCTWLTENKESGETEKRISAQCKTGRQVATNCIYSCGLCPTPTPPVPTPPVPTPTPPVSNPVPVSEPTPASEPAVGGAKNPSGEPPSTPTDNSPSTPTDNSPSTPTDAQATEGTVVLYYRADVYHSTANVDSATFQLGLNSFLAGTLLTDYKNHKMLSKMHNEGISSIYFEPMDFVYSCTTTEPVIPTGLTVTDNFNCDSAIGSAIVTYDFAERRGRERKRYLAGGIDTDTNPTSTVLDIIDELLLNNEDGLNNILYNEVGMLLFLTTLSEQQIASISNAEDGFKVTGPQAGKILGIVFGCLIAVLIVAAYVVHRRRQNSIIVELEEQADLEQNDKLMMSPNRQRRRMSVVQTEQMQFPVSTASKEEANYLPGLDFLCGSNESS